MCSLRVKISFIFKACADLYDYFCMSEIWKPKHNSKFLLTIWLWTFEKNLKQQISVQVD